RAVQDLSQERRDLSGADVRVSELANVERVVPARRENAREVAAVVVCYDSDEDTKQSMEQYSEERERRTIRATQDLLAWCDNPDARMEYIQDALSRGADVNATAWFRT